MVQMFDSTAGCPVETQKHSTVILAELVFAGVMLFGMSNLVSAADAALPTGAIVIHSEPAGAYVCIDGSYCQYTFSEGYQPVFTGLIQPEVIHTFTVSKEGYEMSIGVFSPDSLMKDKRIDSTLRLQ
jgi:hypothetical protein